MLSALNGTALGFGVIPGGSAGPRVARRRIAVERKLARGATARTVFFIDVSIAFPIRIELGFEGTPLAGAPDCTMPAGGGAGAFSAAFFLAVSAPVTRSDDPSRSDGISMRVPSEQVGALGG